MVQIKINVPRETARPAPPFDLIWQNSVEDAAAGYADFALASSDELNNRGGLQSKYPLETAIAMLLFTNRRRPDEIPDDSGSLDRQGWAGDSFDIDVEAGEQELGSYLWTLKGQSATKDTLEKAKDYARQALLPLMRQRIVEDFTIEAEFEGEQMRLLVVAIGPNESVLLNKYVTV